MNTQIIPRTTQIPKRIGSKKARIKSNFKAIPKAQNSPDEIMAGVNTNLVFTVRKETGEVVKDLEIVHEKPMHLIVVSEDLSEFYHLHPEPQADGTLQVDFVFPNGGKYRLYTDFKPKGAEQMVQNFPLEVKGNKPASKELKPDEKFEKTVEGLKVLMETDGELESNKEMMLNFSVKDAATGELATDLENYLGEKAHFVIISQNLEEFVHAHPMSMDNVKEEHLHDANTENKPDEKLMKDAPDANISAHVQFPNAGIYKIFVEVKRQGKVIAVPFVVNVKQGKEEKILSETQIPDGAIKIVVSREGFTPGEVSLSKDKPVKLAFVRIDEENCGDEIVFKDLNIRKKLPVGEVVLVDIPNDKSAEINFACGMDMLKGKIIIQ